MLGQVDEDEVLMTAALDKVCGSIPVTGANLAYRVEGRGPSVLVLGSAKYYPRTFSPKFKQCYRVAYADLRHFAESQEPLSRDELSLDLYLADVEQVRRAVGFEKFVLVGHSHHGNLALEYAKRHPERVSHLILVGTPPCNVQRTLEVGRLYWDEHASEARKRALAENQASLDSKQPTSMPPEEAFVSQYVSDGPKYWYDLDFDARPLWHHVPLDLTALQAFRCFFVDYDFSWNPARMNAPVLALMGRYDYAVPHLLWDEALPKLHNVTYRLLEKSGHTPQLEESAVFDQTVAEWLKLTA